MIETAWAESFCIAEYPQLISKWEKYVEPLTDSVGVGVRSSRLLVIFAAMSHCQMAIQSVILQIFLCVSHREN